MKIHRHTISHVTYWFKLNRIPNLKFVFPALTRNHRIDCSVNIRIIIILAILVTATSHLDLADLSDGDKRTPVFGLIQAAG